MSPPNILTGGIYVYVAHLLLPWHPVPTTRETIRRTRAEIRNWYSVGVLASMVMPTRIPPRRGMAGTSLGRHVVTFRMRDGSRVTCRLQDAGDLVSVYIEQDYAPFAISWSMLSSIIDVGATTGCFTLWALQKAPKARIVAIEPNPTVYPFLVKNVIANRLTDQVMTMPVALGGRPAYGEVVDRTYSTFATVVEQATAGTRTVRMATLEQVMDEAGLATCDLLKMDIEGGEYDVLLSALPSTLERIKAIICEFHPMPNRSVENLVGHLAGSRYRISVSGGPIGFLFAQR